MGLQTDSVPTSLREFQAHIARKAVERGFGHTSLLAQALKLTEETGEVAKAVLRRESVPMDPASAHSDLEAELADVLIVVASIADKAGIDLADAVRAKEHVNETRTWS